mgnify:CR=1 FL=1
MLEDLYGIDTVQGTFFAVRPENNGFLRVIMTDGVSEHYNAYTGRVLTMISGPNRGLSTRIAFSMDAGGLTLSYLEAFDQGAAMAVDASDLVGHTFLINGRPFNALEGAAADEGFDAPHRYDPHLAYVPSSAVTEQQTFTGAADPNLRRLIIPSFADRAVMAQDNWPIISGVGTGDGRADAVVDNDRDGLLDSVWADFGFAIKTTSDGRRYKPFAAVLCVDMDGRLHLNAHGTTAQTAAGYSDSPSGTWAGSSGATSNLNLRRGSGYGPAEVNPSGLFSATAYSALLASRYAPDAPGSPGPGGGVIEDLWRLNAQSISTNYFGAAPAGYASPPDVHGRGMIGLDHAGRPMTHNMGLADEVSDSPYQINLVELNGRDRPFTATELERLLRWNDVDRDALPKIWDRHANLNESDFSAVALRRSVTTASAYLPVPTGPIDPVRIAWERLTNFNADPFAGPPLRSDAMRPIVPFELLHGGKMNVNRLWGNGFDDSGNLIIDEMTTAEYPAGERVYDGVSQYPVGGIPPKYNNNINSAAGQTARLAYARHLYCLMLLVMDQDDNSDADDSHASHTVAAANRIEYRIPVTEALTPGQIYDLTLQRIAQWAINCVDYRDPDAIMTPFEYDMNPFDGWDMDGDPLTVEDDGSGGVHPDRRVVWGCEYPDLVFTESFAMHDRRVRDTLWDDHSSSASEDAVLNGATPEVGTTRARPDYLSTDNNRDESDKDLDQVRIPEGTTMLELYCTRNLTANNPILPTELYTSGQLDLAKMVSGFPVWRIAISKPHHSTAGGDGVARNPTSPLLRRVTNPDSITFEPSELSVSGDDPIDRYVWFGSAKPVVDVNVQEAGTTATPITDRTFYNKSGGAALVSPGGYAVVGPRTTTYVGSKPESSAVGATATTSNADQTIGLTTGTKNLDYTDTAGTAAYPQNSVPLANINTPVAITAVIDSTGYPADRGLNVSEPLPADPETKYPVPTHARAGVTDAYGDDTGDPTTDATVLYPDTPFDSDPDPDGNAMTAGRRPLEAGGITDTQTVENYRTAYLQRLANPLIAWNPLPSDPAHDNSRPVNPYVTVDWIPIDLTVFNGEDRDTTGGTPPAHINATINNSFDTDDTSPQTPKFTSRERISSAAATAATNNFWKPGGLTTLPAGNAEVAAADECFRYEAKFTLGYVSNPYTPLGGSAVGDPDAPFQWLSWPNRPFLSHYELMLVPASTQSRLPSEFTPAQTGTTPYLNSNHTGMFGHLLNFYHASGTGGGFADFARIFEFLETPSPYAGTVRWYDYVYTSNTASGMNSASDFGLLLGTQYEAPFHGLTRFRDPGRVNLNTMPDRAVWEAIDSNGQAGVTRYTSWDKVDASRRGTHDGIGRFANPFGGGITNGTVSAVTQSNIELTMLRHDIDPATGTLGTLPLFGPPVSSGHYNDPAAHAYFRMQALHGLGNIVSTQSNVYAIWVTVGFFEVDGTGTPIRELGNDTGEVRRHRGFFMYDRSVPVAYQRGVNNNVDHGILIRRYIE